MDKRVINKTFLLSCIISFSTHSLKANDISTAYNQTIHLASGYEQLVKESPATVSIFTSEDIEKIGAITLEEVLETIPGIHVTDINGFYPVYTIRGIGSALNTPVLIYLDGIPINTSVTSSSNLSLSHLVKNIDRIEIIKGPGSALYGADAYSGVINIITKQVEETEIGGFAGSFDTYGGWLNHGYRLEDLSVNFSAQGRHTKGSQGVTTTERQDVFGTNASLAPAVTDRSIEDIDIKFSAQYQEFAKVYLRYIRNKKQDGIGITNALDNAPILSDSWITGLELKFGSKDWQTTLDLNYTGYIFDMRLNFPKGMAGDQFDSSALGFTAHDFSTQLSTIYQRIKDHTLHLGIGFEYDTVTDLNEKGNSQDLFKNILSNAGSLEDTQELGVLAFSDLQQERYNIYGFIQDEWRFLSDFSLIAGIRLDYFSDFELSVNPRASLIWDMSSSVTTKIMYGRAFRAPSFFELYTNPGASVTRNRNLKPETIQTVEWSIHKLWPHNFTTQLNLFWYETEDLIAEKKIVDGPKQLERSVFENTEGAHAYGLEFEFNYQILDNLEFSTNYAYLNLNPKSQKHDQFIISAIRHQIHTAINWNFTPNWSANLRSTSIIGRKRSSMDTRPSIKDYTQLDFVLHGKRILGSFDVTFKINNFLDANVREPSNFNISSMRGDSPLDGRSFMGIVSMKF